MMRFGLAAADPFVQNKIKKEINLKFMKFCENLKCAQLRGHCEFDLNFTVNFLTKIKIKN